MRIQTKFFGEMELHSGQRWRFPKGIPGFQDKTEFALLPIKGNTTFQVLQSLTDINLALIVANPYELVENYSFDIDESTIELLEIKEAEEIFVLGVLSIKDKFEFSTINIQAPIIFQTKTKKAKQMILNDNALSVRHVIGSQFATIIGEV